MDSTVAPGAWVFLEPALIGLWCGTGLTETQPVPWADAWQLPTSEGWD